MNIFNYYIYFYYDFGYSIYKNEELKNNFYYNVENRFSFVKFKYS